MAARGANRYLPLLVVALMLVGCGDRPRPSELASGSPAAETPLGSATAAPTSTPGPSATPGSGGPDTSATIQHLDSALPLADGRVLLIGSTLAQTWEADWVQPYDPATGQSGERVWLTRQGGSAAPLPDGRVLFTGGTQRAVDLDGWRLYLATAEIHDPATGRVLLIDSSMEVPRVGHTVTPLLDGRVLIAGGTVTDANPVTTTSADLYDPRTGAIRPTGQMGIDRAGHTAIRLDDGRVLLFGGHSGESQAESAELYDPATERFQRIDGPTGVPSGVRSALLEDGRVLVAGIAGNESQPVMAQAAIYDPQTDRTVDAGALTAMRGGATVTRLHDGRVLIAGGHDGSTALTSAEIFDADPATSRPTGELATARAGHGAVLLPDGRVLIAGGESCDPDALAAEIFDPATGRFEAAPGSSNGALGSLLLDSCPVPEPTGTFTAVSGSCAIRVDGTLACWGDNSSGQARPPAGTFSAVSGSCAIRTEGTLVCWGEAAATLVPGPVVAIGGTCALRASGEPSCWNGAGDPPAGQRFVSVSGAGWSSCGIRVDGTLACWGEPETRATPAGAFTSVVVDDYYACALREDGRVVCWGGLYGIEPPQPPETAFAAFDRTCGIRADGTLECWEGADGTPAPDPPDGTFSAIGGDCAIRVDGQLECWTVGG